jgi:ABC-type transport system involved in cytochrome c biogenesis ATPase subunit
VEVIGFPTQSGPIDVQLHAGDRLLIKGANGSGKTSLLRCLAGLAAPRGNPGKPGATLCFQDARDCLVGLTIDGERRLRARPELGDQRAIATLSTGEATRLALELTKSGCWLLDEPAEPLDDDGIAWLRAEIARHDGAIAFVDHTGKLHDLATKTVDLGTVAGQLPKIANQSRQPLQIGKFTTNFAFAVLTGPNGCGKSTLLRQFALQNQVAYLPPNVKDMLFEPKSSHWVTAPARHPLQWSGGELQRLALATIFGSDAHIFVLDEPDKHLDAAGVELLGHEIQGVIDAGGRVIMATHGDWDGEALCW